MFYLAFVCLSVCLSVCVSVSLPVCLLAVSRISLKFSRYMYEGLSLGEEELVKFRKSPASVYASRNLLNNSSTLLLLLLQNLYSAQIQASSSQRGWTLRDRTVFYNLAHISGKN